MVLDVVFSIPFDILVRKWDDYFGV